MTSSRRGNAWGRVALTLTLATLPVASARGAIPPAALQDEWREIRTEHFTILTNDPGGAAAGIGRRLEQYSAFLAEAFPGYRAISALPTDVFVFRTQELLDAYRPPEMENVLGYTSHRELRNVIVMNAAVDGPEKSQVLCHEYLHVFNANNFDDLPPWLNEGLAEYYGTYRPRGRVVEFGHRREHLMAWMQEHELAPLDLLFAANNASRAYQKDNELRTTLYAQGWMMVHYLQADSGRARRFQSFLDELHQRTPVRAAFEQQFPSDGWPALYQGLGRYAREDFLSSRKITLAAAPSSVEPVTRPISEAEALLRLGGLLDELGEERRAAAIEHYRAALAKDSTRARAWARLGRCADATGDTVSAEADYANALRLGGDDPLPPLIAGLGTLDRAVAEYRASHTVSPGLVRLARERIGRALQFQPDHPSALAGFGRTFLLEGRMPDPGFRALQEAWLALPDRDDIDSDLEQAREIRKRAGAATSGRP